MISRIQDGLLLHVKLTPRARQNKIIGLTSNELRMSLNAPPIDGAANMALIAFISKLLKIPKSNIAIVRGEKSRSKSLLLKTDIEIDAIRDLLSLEVKSE